MKILFPCMTFYPAQIGGPNNTLFWHTTYLKDRGFQPRIITNDYGITEDIEIVKGKWLHRGFGSIIYIHEKFIKLPFKTTYCTLMNLKKADVVHFNGMYNRVTLFLIFIVALTAKPIVLSPRGELFGAAIKRKSFGKKILLFFFSVISKKILFHATSIEEQETIKLYFDQVRTVVQSNFIVANYVEKSNEYRKDFLFLGRINPIKNIHLLIEGASKSKNFIESEARIIIAGKAWLNHEIDYQNELILLVSNLGMRNKVVFVGHVENEAKEKLIKEAYFLVLPSKSENFGNVVLEALIKGTPVIASAGTPWQTLNDYSAGYWIECNKESIADTIDKALSLKEDEYIGLSKNSMNLVKSVYDVYSKENRWLEIYQNLKH